MKFTTSKISLAQVETGLLLIGVYENQLDKGYAAAINSAGENALAAQAAIEGFTGQVGQTQVYYPGLSMAATRVLLYGLGERRKLDVHTLRKALLAAFRKARELKVAEITVGEVPLAGTRLTRYQFAETVATWAGLIDYEVFHNKTDHRGFKPQVHVDDLRILTTRGGTDALRDGLINGRNIAESVNLARDLSNMPAGHLTPLAFARYAQQVADESEGTITPRFVHMEELKAMGAGLFLAVNQGSAEPCVLIELTYTPPTGATETVLGLVGKTITFDSGGLDLKTADGMRGMKHDMSGGAAVLAAIKAIAALKLPVSVKAYFAATENMPDGRAVKPGDVLVSLNGITVEVDNTDAEGRLTLADAIEFAKRQGVTHIVDVATLTGAIRQVNSDVAAGLFTNKDAFGRLVLAAGVRAGENHEMLTMWPELRDCNKAVGADLKNTGGPGGAGATTAAWFIREFAGEDIPWVHLDIASVAFRDRELGADPKGGTGASTRTLIELARMMAAIKAGKR